jgi:hypothetical protein
MQSIPIDFETSRRRAWLARGHFAAIEARARAAGWGFVLLFVWLGAAQ